MANHFQIPQGETFIPGYYYSNVELKLSNVATDRGAYIGTVRGDKNATIDNRFIYYCASLDQAPVLVDRYIIPTQHTVYLLSTEYNTLGTYGNNQTVNIPSGRMAIYVWENGGLELYNFDAKFSKYFTSPRFKFGGNNSFVDVRTHADWTENPTSPNKKVHEENKIFSDLIYALSSNNNIVGAKYGDDNYPQDWPTWSDITTDNNKRKIVEDFNSLHKNYTYLWVVRKWTHSDYITNLPLPPKYTGENDADGNPITTPGFTSSNKYQYGYNPNNSRIEDVTSEVKWSRIDLGAAGAKFNQTWDNFSTHMCCKPDSWLQCGFNNNSQTPQATDHSTDVVFTNDQINTLADLVKQGILTAGRRASSEDWHKYDIYVNIPRTDSNYGDFHTATAAEGTDSSNNIFKSNKLKQCGIQDKYFDICFPGTWKSLDLLTWWWKYAMGVYVHATGGGESPVLKYSDEFGWACTYTSGYGRAEEHSRFEFAFSSNVSSYNDVTKKIDWNIERLSFTIQGPGTAIGVNGTIDGDYVIEGGISLSIKTMNHGGNMYAYCLNHSGNSVAPKYFMPDIEIKMINAQIRKLGTTDVWTVQYEPYPSSGEPITHDKTPAGQPKVVKATDDVTVVERPAAWNNSSINSGSTWIPGSAILDEP